MARRARRNRLRSWTSLVLLVLSGVLLLVGLVSTWANATVYDSATFSERTVDVLKEPAVRRELARQLTEQLALGGDKQAVTFRPGFQLAIEAAVDTDTFRSIFRTAVRRTHEAILGGQGGGAGLNLSDSIGIIASTLQLPNNLKPGEQEGSSLGHSLDKVTRRLSDLGVWQANDLTASLALGGFAGAFAAAAAGVALATDRRKAVLRVGLVILVVGLVVVAVVPATQWLVSRSIDDPQLAGAVRGALGRAMADLTTIGLWVAAYGVVAAAAAASMGDRAHRFTPKGAANAVGRWVERRRTTTGGTVALGVVAILAAVTLSQDPAFWLRVTLLGASLWLAYFGVTELLGLVRRVVPASDAAERRSPARRVAAVAGAVVVLLAAVTGGLVLTAGRAARRAQAAGRPLCNGDASLCDLPLNLVLFAGSHNAMSSALNPGWLFAEHARTIESQLDEGVRALLIDTHYGIPSASRLPGSETQLVLTDRAAELHDPYAERADPAAAQRADQLAARAPRAAAAARGIYLCHTRCELGATRFGDSLGGIRSFVESHPDEVVMLVIEDHTDPAETAAAIADAGLAERAYTLRPDRPLPTLGDMIRSGRNLLVMAEVGGSGAPPWYHKAYDWFQETPYDFDRIDQFSCAPNRGPANAPLFLVNHWVSNHDPAVAAKVNSRRVLVDRVRRCLAERGRMPNLVAVDFTEKGDLEKTVRDLNHQLLGEFRALRRAGRPPPSAPTTPTTTPPDVSATPAATLPPISQSTPIATLTGGDPGLFCPTIPATNQAVSTWALASLVATPGTRGLPDLALGPVVARSLGATLAAAPTELAHQAGPALDRARAAVAALRGMGLDQAAVDHLADVAAGQIASPEDPDPVRVQAALVDDLQGLVGADRLSAAAAAFSDSHPEPPGLFDFGAVSDAAARAADYPCLAAG